MTLVPCPYKGLQYFDSNPQDADNFYGREDLIEKLITKIESDHFLALVGASGSGKSSLLRAGLAYQIQQKVKADSLPWQVNIMNPGQDPLQNLALCLVDSQESYQKKVKQFINNKLLIEFSISGLSKIIKIKQNLKNLLIIDHLEELFLLANNLDKDKFLESLIDTLEEIENNFYLVLSINYDCLEQLIATKLWELFGQNSHNLIFINSLTSEQLKAAIVKPAKKVNLDIESSLIEQIIEDSKKQANYLPLLQYTLRELWKHKENNCLQLKTYHQLGGLRQILNKRLTEIYQGLPQQQQQLTQDIFLKLAHLEIAQPPISQGIFKAKLGLDKYSESLIDEVLQIWSNEQILHISKIFVQASEYNTVYEIKLAHDILMRDWELFKQWLEEKREGLQQKEQIEFAAKIWQNHNYKTRYLLKIKQLKAIKLFQENYPKALELHPLLKNFINLSIRQEKIQRIKFFLIFLLLPLTFLTIGAWTVFSQIRLHYYTQVLTDCINQKNCSQQLEAVAALVKAKKNLDNINLNQANLGGINLKGANLKEANLNQANLYEANLQEANLYRTYLSEAYLFRANLERANLEGAYLSQTNLREANLSSANLQKTYLYQANLAAANLKRAHLYRVNLDSANLAQANLEWVYLYQANLKKANLFQVNLFDANLEKANLFTANLSGANLKATNLLQTNFTAANLEKADLRGAYLKGTILVQANLKDADFTKHSIFGTVEYLSPTQVKSACNWQQAKFEPQFTEELKKTPNQIVDCSQWE